MTSIPNPWLSESVAASPTDDPAAVNSARLAAAGSPFVLDEARFMADIEAAPAFLAAPSHEYLAAVERA